MTPSPKRRGTLMSRSTSPVTFLFSETCNERWVISNCVTVQYSVLVSFTAWFIQKDHLFWSLSAVTAHAHIFTLSISQSTLAGFGFFRFAQNRDFTRIQIFVPPVPLDGPKSLVISDRNDPARDLWRWMLRLQPSKRFVELQWPPSPVLTRMILWELGLPVAAHLIPQLQHALKHPELIMMMMMMMVMMM